MYYRDQLSSVIVTGVRGFGSFCLSVVNAVAGASPRLSDGNDSDRDFQIEIWKFRRLLRTALGDGVDQEVIGAIGWLARNSDRIERAVVAWVDLIESLVQVEERQYGGARGFGRLKKDEVKQVIRILLVKQRIRVPHVPDFLVPAFLDIFVDWVVDAVVLTANRHGMWEASREPPRHSRVFWTAIRKWLRALFRPVWSAILWTSFRIYALFRRETSLSPEVLAALKTLEDAGLIVQASDLIVEAEKLLVWISTRRPQLIAALELVLAAVQEAEAFIELPGFEKKAYAQRLVLAVLDEMGFQERTGLLFAVINSLIGSSIEAIVRLFNKRSVFLHSGAAS